MRSACRAAIAFCLMLAFGLSAASAAPRSKTKSSHQAQIYFIRPQAPLGLIVRPDIKINGRTIGELAIGSYIAINRPSGRYTIGVRSGVDPSGFETDVEVAAGTSYYFELGPIPIDVVALALSGVSGTPMEGRGNLLTGYIFYRLSPVVGAEIVKKLKRR